MSALQKYFLDTYSEILNPVSSERILIIEDGLLQIQIHVCIGLYELKYKVNPKVELKL